MDNGKYDLDLFEIIKTYNKSKRKDNTEALKLHYSKN